ncbi:MAG: formylglycine-generating enzyme family protein [Planctomycetota bacterium]
MAEGEPHFQPDCPQHSVRIERPVLLARTPLTQRVYDSGFGFADRAAMTAHRGMSWLDAARWCQDVGMRLPTEAEWEFACRAGSNTAYCFGNEHRADLAGPLHKRNTLMVGALPANAFGLLGMHSGPCEWCQDVYADYLDSPVDGSAAEMESAYLRVIRGGGFGYVSAHRAGAPRARLLPRNPAGAIGQPMTTRLRGSRRRVVVVVVVLSGRRQRGTRRGTS